MTRVLILVVSLFVTADSMAGEPVDIGSRRELFVDDALVGEHVPAVLVLRRTGPQVPWVGGRESLS